MTYGRGAWMADITGPAAAPLPGVASISTPSVTLGGAPITVSKTSAVIITNTGAGALTLSSISVSGSGFSQTNSCGAFP